jgi:RNA polymerase sigma-70 factor, ECF subfamily
VESLERLIVQQIPRLRRYARALAGDPSRADDLLQDCLERAWSQIHRWQRGSDMRAWLFTIMHNVYANMARQHQTGPKLVPMDEEEQNLGVEATQEASLEVRDLTAGLAALPEQQREILLLVSLEDMSYEQVSRILEIPLGTVMSRLHRARERLRTWMAGTGQIGLGVAK